MGISLAQLRAAGVRIPHENTAQTQPPKRNKPRGTGAASMRKKLMLSLRIGVESRPGYMRAVLPVKLVSECNSGEPVWARRVRRDNQKRMLATYVHQSSLPALPATVRFTRYGKRKLDLGDNLQSSQKHLRDMLATMYGVNDGNNSPLKFELEIGDVPCGDYFVVIEITSTGKESK